MHVVLRVVNAIGNLRRRDMYRAVREATIAVARREPSPKCAGDFQIVHISIQQDHIHLLVEAGDKTSLSRGMQRFQISAAKHLNAASVPRIRIDAATPAERRRARAAHRKAMARRRRGTVFADRFYQEIITTPKQARNTLAYVLNNWRKHREDRGARASTWSVDPYSTGVLFDGWQERESNNVLMRLPATYELMIVYVPRTWLLREGWQRHGLVSFREVPIKQGAARVRPA